jgi:hypothetical protein
VGPLLIINISYLTVIIFPLVGPLLVINISYLTNDFSPCGSFIGNKHILSDCNDFPLYW